jgi:hypothetical protein
MQATKAITITLQDDEIDYFFSIIDKVEKHRCNEGQPLRLSHNEAGLQVKLHDLGFDEGIIKE